MNLKEFFGNASGTAKETIDFLRAPTIYGRALISTENGPQHKDIKNINNISADLGSNYKNTIISVKFTTLVDQDAQISDIFNSSTLKEFQLQEGISSIPANTFQNCSSLTEAIIPDSVKIIGDYAFQNCENLEDVSLGTGLLSIEDYAFQNCKSLKYICIPNTCESIGQDCFNNCQQLKYAVIGDNEKLSSISKYEFANCINLSTVNFGKYNRIAMADAFNGCSNLRKIKFPEGFQAVSNLAFNNISSCEELYLPDSIQNLAADAFLGCNVNCKVIYAGTKYKLQNEIFKPMTNTKTYPFGFSEGTTISCSDGVITVGANTPSTD